ncbi:MAG: pantetheine-phosphate adenylyltransferase [Clostridia bacterium]|jgi:pantetheine-phosphate adenylyltransferase|nr:pantetheine-phosphate adenylyltransferase [Clostridia bacterium]
MNDIIAVCPGSFDPVTVGHIDIISRAAQMFSEVVVVVMHNPSKSASFTVEERVEMIELATADLKNVRVDSFEGLLADYTKKIGAGAIVKGLRAMSDFEYEFQMALTNKKLNPDTETVFLSTRAENMYLSSSMVKQIGCMGGDISDFVPKNLVEKIMNRLKNQ